MRFESCSVDFLTRIAEDLEKILETRDNRHARRELLACITSVKDTIRGAKVQERKRRHGPGEGDEPPEIKLSKLDRLPMMDLNHFLEGEQRSEPRERWPPFPTWCLQESTPPLPPLAPRLFHAGPGTTISTPGALAIMRQHLHDKLKIAISAMNLRWPRVGLWLRGESHKKGRTKIVSYGSSGSSEAPDGLGRHCLVWVARKDTIQDGLRNRVSVQDLYGNGAIAFCQKCGVGRRDARRGAAAH